MVDNLKVSRLSIEGFRGINKRVDLNLDKKSTVIFGGNGTGKTSILQSIEWGIFGDLPYMRGGEYELEDAIVNQFHQARTSKVQLELESEDQSYQIIRKREKGKNSQNRSETQFKLDNINLHDQEADRKIIETIGLCQDDFYSTVYMHQDAVKTLVSGNPNERSDIIDKLLGTHLLRDLLKALPLSSINLRRKELENLILDLENSHTEEHINDEKSSLEKIKNNMLAKGFTSEDFQSSYLVKNLEKLTKELEEIRLNLGLTIPSLRQVSDDINEIQEYSSNFLKILTEIEEDLTSNLRSSAEKTEKTKEMRARYVETLDNLAAYDIEKFEDNFSIKRDLTVKINSLENKIHDSKEKKTFLENKLSKLTQLNEERNKLQEEMNFSLRPEWKDKVKEDISKLHNEIQELTNEKNRSQTYTQLLTLSVEYFEKSRSSNCPLCKSTLSPLALSNKLREEISKIHGGTAILDYVPELEKLEKEKKHLEEQLSTYTKLHSRLEEILSESETLRNTIRETLSIENLETDNLVDELSTLCEDIEVSEKDLIGLKSKLLKLDDQGSLMKNIFTNFEKLKSTIKSSFSDWSDKEGLRFLDKKIDTELSEVKRLENLNIQIKNVKNNLFNQDDMISYHLRLNHLIRLEGEIPQVKRKIEELNLRLQKLKSLEISLVKIRNAISEEQNNSFKKVFSDVQETIEDYYNRILNHPYYSKLEIELQSNQEGINTYWIKCKGENNSTYARTRFSEAQLNATAIALFLAMVKHYSHHLNFVVFDDPTQSMDKDHKEALAKLLCHEMKNRQIIISTQDREFYQLLKRNMDSKYAKCFNMEQWDMNGPVITSASKPLITIQNRARSLLHLF